MGSDLGILKNNTLGSISGKTGNLIVRPRYGKDIIYTVPARYNVSQSEKALLARRKFANTVEFAKVVNSLPRLASIWKSAKVDGTNSYQKIIKFNSPFINNSGLSIDCSITPNGITLINSSLLFEESTLKVTANILEESAPSFDQLVVLLYFPLNPCKKFLMLISESDLEQLNNTISGKVAYNEKQYSSLTVRDASIAFIAFLSKEGNRNKTFCSNTSAFNLTVINSG